MISSRHRQKKPNPDPFIPAAHSRTQPHTHAQGAAGEDAPHTHRALLEEESGESGRIPDNSSASVLSLPPPCLHPLWRMARPWAEPRRVRRALGSREGCWTQNLNPPAPQDRTWTWTWSEPEQTPCGPSRVSPPPVLPVSHLSWLFWFDPRIK